MTRTARLRRDRMHLRLDAKSKRTLEKAAAFEETTVSDFVLRNAVAAAERVIDARQTVTLSPRDWDVFFEAVTNPPPPNRRLLAAARRYRARFGG